MKFQTADEREVYKSVNQLPIGSKITFDEITYKIISCEWNYDKNDYMIGGIAFNYSPICLPLADADEVTK